MIDDFGEEIDPVWAAICDAFGQSNVAEFVRLVKAYPQYLRDEDDGTDQWMWSAAIDGNLPMIEGLIDLGMDINETADNDDDPENPFYQAEGAILQAAANGHLELVRWMLSHGARINYVVHGSPRCLPLVQASTEGHLDVVKLLVEHGADIHSTWRGINPATQAEDYGHREVLEYLRSVGAKTLRETTPVDYPGGRKRYLKELTKLAGPLNDWVLEIARDPVVTLRVIPANEKCDRHSLITVGLSDHRLAQGWKLHACTELRCILPPDWPLPEDSLEYPEWNWPVEGLKAIVSQLLKTDTWPDPAVFTNDEVHSPVAPDTTMNAWIALKSLGESVQSPDYRWIDMHSVFPIYPEEAELVRKHGHEELVNRFETRDIPLYLDVNRPNVALSD